LVKDPTAFTSIINLEMEELTYRLLITLDASFLFELESGEECIACL
jgi:hypothetical protein